MKTAYEKPVLVKVDKMTFPMEIMHKGKIVACRQCSDCHGCR